MELVSHISTVGMSVGQDVGRDAEVRNGSHRIQYQSLTSLPLCPAIPEHGEQVNEHGHRDVGIRELPLR